MKQVNIKQLLEKYFEGATSLAEEQQLRTYFNSSEVAEELQAYQPLFQYFAQAKKTKLPQQFEGELEAVLQRPAKRRFMRRVLQMGSVAASVMLVIGSYFWYYGADMDTVAEQQIQWEQYEIEDPEQALKETKKALKLLSRKLNSGTKKVAKSVDKVVER